MIVDFQMFVYPLLIVIGLLIGFVLANRISSARVENLNRLWRERFDREVESKVREREEFLRKDAAERSGRTLSARVLERFSPLMDSFPFDPHDAVWIGSPIDYLVFDGLSKGRREGSPVKRVILVEVKSGESRLNKRQRQIRDLVKQGKVQWSEVRIP